MFQQVNQGSTWWEPSKQPEKSANDKGSEKDIPLSEKTAVSVHRFVNSNSSNIIKKPALRNAIAEQFKQCYRWIKENESCSGSKEGKRDVELEVRFGSFHYSDLGNASFSSNLPFDTVELIRDRVSLLYEGALRQSGISSSFLKPEIYVSKIWDTRMIQANGDRRKQPHKHRIRTQITNNFKTQSEDTSYDNTLSEYVIKTQHANNIDVDSNSKLPCDFRVSCSIEEQMNATSIDSTLSVDKFVVSERVSYIVHPFQVDFTSSWILSDSQDGVTDKQHATTTSGPEYHVEIEYKFPENRSLTEDDATLSMKCADDLLTFISSVI